MRYRFGLLLLLTGINAFGELQPTSLAGHAVQSAVQFARLPGRSGCPPSIDRAVRKSIQQISKAAGSVSRCFNCHHNTMPVLALVKAREKGFEVDGNIFKEQGPTILAHFAPYEKYMALEGKKMTQIEDPVPGNVHTVGSALDLLRAADAVPEKAGDMDKALLASMINYSVHQQIPVGKQEKGFWFDITQNRPPSEGNPFESSGTLIRALLHFGPNWARKDKQKSELLKRTLNRGISWMADPDMGELKKFVHSKFMGKKFERLPGYLRRSSIAELEGTQASVSRLRTLSAAKNSKLIDSMTKKKIGKAIQNLKEGLLSQAKKANKGELCWSQLPQMACDAYATGSVLVALAEAGLSPKSLEYQKGLKYLLRTQQSDSGGWVVMSRQIDMPSELPGMQGKRSTIQRLDRHFQDPPLTPQDLEKIYSVPRRQRFDLVHDRKNGGTRRNDGGLAHRVQSQFISMVASSWAVRALLAACGL